MSTTQTQAGVIDTLAAPGTERRHDIITKMAPDGRTPLVIKSYSLNCDTPTTMPLDHAMQFLKEPAFTVTDENGEVIKPLPVHKDGGIGSLVLKQDEVIANLSELSREALYKRCKALPGADAITDKSKAQTYIDFLIAKNAPSVRDNDAVGQAINNAGEQLSAEDLDKLGV